jgi:hypothetical protein
MSRKPTGRRGSVSPKRVLGEALQELGPEATHNSLVTFAKKQYGIRFQFLFVLPKREKDRQVQIGLARLRQARETAS